MCCALCLNLYLFPARWVAHDTMGNLQLLHVCLSFPFVFDKTIKSALLAKQRSARCPLSKASFCGGHQTSWLRCRRCTGPCCVLCHWLRYQRGVRCARQYKPVRL